MAEVILEDTLEDMEVTSSDIPVFRAAELIDNLAREIPRDEKRAQFQRTLINLIPK